MHSSILTASAVLAFLFSIAASAASGPGSSSSNKQGWEITPAVFANQTSQNNGSSSSYRTITTEMDLVPGLTSLISPQVPNDDAAFAPNLLTVTK